MGGGRWEREKAGSQLDTRARSNKSTTTACAAIYAAILAENEASYNFAA